MLNQKSLAEILQMDGWSTVAIEKNSKDVNRFFNGGMVQKAGSEASDLLNALNYDSITSTVEVGMVDSDFEEQNLGDKSNTEAGAIAPYFAQMRMKTYYANKWWEAWTIQKDLANATHQITLIGNKIGAYWVIQWNRLLSSLLAGLSKMPSITTGDGTVNLDRLMVVDAMSLQNDKGIGTLSTMYMSSTTFYDQYKKQITAGDILFERARIYDPKAEADEWVYDGSTPLKIDDTFLDGVITLVKDGAFLHESKNLKKPVMYAHSPKTGNGAGKEEFGTKSLYVLHPKGFSFKGVFGTDFNSLSGLSEAELQSGDLYELVVDVEFSPILNLKVKIGA